MNKRSILYLEDHDDTRELVGLVLRDRDYDVTDVPTIEAAMELVQSTKFHLFLLDSWLADGSGIELCKKIRKVDPDTPIRFYSAAAYERDKDRAMSAGAQAYLTKPASFTEICELVARLIDRDENGSKRNPLDHPKLPPDESYAGHGSRLEPSIKAYAV